MAFIPADEVARFAITFRNTDGNEAVNVIHIKTNEVQVTPTVLDDMADVLAAWLETSWAPIAENSWTAVRLEGLDLTSQGSFYIDRTIAEPGTLDGAAMPSWVTMAVSLRSAFSGRSRRGRLYHVGLAEEQTDGDSITAPFALSLTSAYEDLRDAVTTAGYRWGVVSFVANGAPRTTGLFTDITSITLTDLLLDRQARRKPRTSS